MIDSELLRIVTDFRKGILGRRSPETWCYMVSAPLEGYLRVIGIQARLTKGYVGKWAHDWLTLSDGRIVDATASQFRAPDKTAMPKVYIGLKPDWYRVKVGPQ